ncbi:hypothetical protein HAHE_42720 [Haloferula helveola]|uniref:DUF4384 domain-containing protein n=1 Tax=Haloferula helveola TaxID=490095 RepID=A0ABN6HDK4_9BACT|nr:hypothetical protein HAHE_42720 [Haloferula helveola]
MKPLLLSLGFAILQLRAAEVGEPLDKLPPSIKPAEKTVSLHADYEHPGEDGSIPVYLVNRTDDPLPLGAQDGDIYLKLEIMRPDGTWVRAQPHAYSWCGNSYMASPTIAPGTFYRVPGFQPKDGEEHKIRFALHEQEIQLVTQTGTGRASERDIDLASRDAMAIKEGSFKFVTKVALGELELKNEMDHISDLQKQAIYVLGSGRFETEKARKLLKRILAKFPEREQEIRWSMSRLEEDSDD